MYEQEGNGTEDDVGYPDSENPGNEKDYEEGGNGLEGEDQIDGQTSDGEEDNGTEEEDDTDMEDSYEDDSGTEDEDREKNDNKVMRRIGKEGTREEKGNELKETKKVGKRAKKPCPLPHCDAKVTHLPRHLRNVHQWNTESARTALVRFKLRKEYKFVSQETAFAGNRGRKKRDEKRKNPKKPNRKSKLCPLPGCMVVTERLPQHLQRRHKLKREDAKYKKLLSWAKVVSTKRQHVFLRMKEDRNKKVNLEPTKNHENSDDEFSLNFQDPSFESEEDEYDASLPENSPPDISSHETTTFSENEDMENAAFVTKILEKFSNWMLSPDGEQKDKKTALQHVSQLKRVMSVTGGGLACLLDEKKIRDVFLPQAKEKYYPATIKSYLMSVQHYCSFLLEDQPSGVDYDKDSINHLRDKLKKWSSSYKRQSTRRRWERQEEDVSSLITPEKVKEFEQSQATRDAVILLGKLSGAHSMEITQKMYTLVRDYLIAQIMIDNANRAGVIAFMTVKEFQRAKMEDDRYVVEVLQHKTVDTHGPAQVVLTVHLYNCLDIFLKEMRSKLPGAQTEANRPMFLSWSGKRLQSSQVTKALGSIFKKAGVEGRIHHTLYRKSAVTHCHDKHKNISSHLADLMAHRETTAEKYYRHFDKRKSSVKASQTLHGMMRNVSQKEGNQEKQGTEETVEQLPETHDPQENCAPTARSSWNDESVEAIKAVFKEEISKQDISMACVKEKIKRNPVLRLEDPKRVYDKVRSEWRYKAIDNESSSVEGAFLPEETEDVNRRVERMFSDPKDGTGESSSLSADFVSVTESTVHSKGLFNATQAKALVQLFQDMVSAGRPVSKPVIIERLSKNQIFAEYTVEQVVNRLKYERRQKKKLK